MVLPGYALMAQGTQIHVAAWPGHDWKAPESPIPVWTRQLLLSRAFASQAGSYVIVAGGLSSLEHVPERYHDLDLREYPGDSYIIDPRGEVIAGPAKGETILTARGSTEEVLAAKAACDVGGHYSRPDVLQLLVHGRPLERVIESVRPDYTEHFKVDFPSESKLYNISSNTDSEQKTTVANPNRIKKNSLNVESR